MRCTLCALAVLVLTLVGCGIDWFPVTTVSDFTFSPAAVTGVTGGATQTSDTVTLAMSSPSAAITVSGDASSKYSLNGAAFTNAAGTAKNGDKVAVQHTAARGASGVVTTTLAVGAKSASFTSTTSATSTVTAFSFSPAFTNASTNVVKSSNPVTISIVGAEAAISVSGGNSTGKYKINDGAFTSTAGTVINNDKVTVQHNTGTVLNTKLVTTLTIGTRFANFSTTATH